MGICSGNSYGQEVIHFSFLKEKWACARVMFSVIKGFSCAFICAERYPLQMYQPYDVVDSPREVSVIRCGLLLRGPLGEYSPIGHLFRRDLRVNWYRFAFRGVPPSNRKRLHETHHFTRRMRLTGDPLHRDKGTWKRRVLSLR